MKNLDPASFQWLFGEWASLGVAGCITLVKDAREDRLAAILGVDDSLGTRAPVEDYYSDEHPGLGFAPSLGSWIPIVEFNGFQGSREAFLRTASVGTIAASAFWNVNMVTQVACAEAGSLVLAFEPGSSEGPRGSKADDFLELVEAAAVAVDSALPPAVAMACLARLTGVTVGPDTIASVQSLRVLRSPYA